MCQLTQGTHAPLYSGLSSGLALCLFFLQWKGSSVYNSHLRPSLVNILPATAVRCANTAPTLPSVLLFWFFLATPPTSYEAIYSRDKRGCKMIWSACKFSSFHVSNPSACDGFYSLQLEGAAEGEESFQISASSYRGREKLISFNIMQTSITAGQKVGVLLKDQMDGGLGRGLWGALESVVVGLHR